MERLKSFLEIRIKRELGKTEKMYSGEFLNRRIDYAYIFLTARNEYPLEYYPSLLPLEQEFEETVNFNFPMDVFEQLVFSAIKLFQFSKHKNIVNQRLSFLCFYTMCSLKTEDKDHIFSQMLYFLQNSESFLDKMKLRDNRFYYDDQEIDLVDYSDHYFNFLILNRTKLEDGQDFTSIELEGLKSLISQFFKGILDGVNFENQFFSISSFLDKYKKDRQGFFSELSDCLEYYHLDEKENSDHNTSLYSSRSVNNKLANSRRVIKKKKVYSEYFIDSYILHFLNRETILEDSAFLTKEKSQYLKLIIVSHSFVRVNKKSKGLLNTLLKKI